MASAVVVSCTADAWTKVATNLPAATVHILDSIPSQYLYTYRDTTGAAPSGTPGAEAVVMRFGEPLTVQVYTGGTNFDLYVYAKGGTGSVRVDALV